MRAGRVAAVVAVLAAVSAPLWCAPLLRPLRFFGVRRVDVVGARYLAPAAVVAGLGLRPEASVFDDLEALREHLLLVPGVASAKVTRRLPGTLVVAIVEREPVALADGPDGLVALDATARPLPYDPTAAPVDAPIVERADSALLAALETIRTSDLGFFAGVAAARTRGGEVVLDLGTGRARLGLPVEPAIVQQVSAVERDLAVRALPWRELDARFHGWVVVRREARAERAQVRSPVQTPPRRHVTAPARPRAATPARRSRP
jgi:POTRA domain-containing FtsQ-type protein